MSRHRSRRFDHHPLGHLLKTRLTRTPHPQPPSQSHLRSPLSRSRVRGPRDAWRCACPPAPPRAYAFHYRSLYCSDAEVGRPRGGVWGRPRRTSRRPFFTSRRRLAAARPRSIIGTSDLWLLVSCIASSAPPHFGSRSAPVPVPSPHSRNL